MTEPLRLVVGRRHIAHQGRYSGYGQVVSRLRAMLPVKEIPGGAPSGLPEALARRLIERTGRPWYDSDALRIDLAVARALWRGETCHLLYGEDTLFYSGLSRRLGAPGRLAVTFHQPPDLLDELVRDRAPLAGVDAAIGMSSELRDHLASRLRRARAVHIPLGVDTDFFKPADGPRRGCLFVGWWQRDIDVLAAVARRVRAELPDAPFHAVVPEWTRAEVESATGAEVVSNVSDDELRRRYREAAVVVLPLKSATSNNTLVEAAACASAIVVTDLPGVRDHVGRDCAELVAPGDAEAMAERVLELLADPARRELLGGRARERTLELDWDAIAERHLEVYRGLSV